MAGQPYTWQISTATNTLGTGPGRISSAYNVDGKTPLTTVTQANPDGFVPVNTLSSDPVVSKTEYKIDQDGVITYRYTGPRGGVSSYNSIQDLIDDVKVTPSVGYQIRSAVGSSIIAEARQKNIGQGAIGLPSLPPSANTQGTQLTPKNIDVPTIETEGVRDKYDNYYYPESLRGNSNKQDIIRFTAFKYVGRTLTIGDTSQNSFGSPGLGPRNIKEKKNLLGSVTLPIQPSITDTNTVQWGSEDLNPLQAFGAAASYGAATDINLAAQQVGEQVDKLFKQSNFSNSARIFLAGKAVGVNGLLSRIGGGVLNPNMELLFQGPQLRPFNFTFRLSPRDEKEAQQVKYIIRFFKENMSVQNTADNIFLKAPNVFQINYLIKGEKNHPSLNRIKICALQSCSVDYTPDGSYMTFNDADATMTSYNLTLQFQELEPVTAKEYTDLGNTNEIGY